MQKRKKCTSTEEISTVMGIRGAQTHGWDERFAQNGIPGLGHSSAIGKSVGKSLKNPAESGRIRPAYRQNQAESGRTKQN